MLDTHISWKQYAPNKTDALTNARFDVLSDKEVLTFEKKTTVYLKVPPEVKVSQKNLVRKTCKEMTKIENILQYYI